MLPQTPSDRLHLLLQRTPEEVFEPDYASDVPLVQFVAFGTNDRVFGWVRLRADRLTDLLNTHDELLLTDAEIESLEDGVTRSVDEVLIRCSELIAVHASAPRGDEARRRLTRTHPIAIQSGNYLIGGYLHAPTGSDPIASMGERPLMVPLTDAWIEYWSGRGPTKQSSGTIIVNRERADWMRVVTDDDLFGGMLRPTPTPDRMAS
jgi:hypothetical protein